MPRKFTSGWKRQAKDDRDYQFHPARKLLRSLPQAADLSSGMGPQLDQGALGTCGPNSAAECIAYDQRAESLAVNGAARLFVYYTTRALMGTLNEDSGVDNRTMLKALNQSGFAGEQLYPYSDDPRTFKLKPPQAVYDAAKPNRIINYAAVQQAEAVMKGTIASGLPFIFGFDVFNGMLSDAVAQTGIVPMPGPGETPVGGHDVTFVGYDDAKRLYKFRNHWMNSPDVPWGDNGYGYMPYDYAHNPNLSSDFWVINAVPGQIAPPAPIPTPVPTPPAPSPINIQQQIDAVFAVLIAQAGSRPIVALMLRTVQTLIDNYLATHPVSRSASLAPADLKAIIDLVFQAIETSRPAWASYLQVVNAMIDAYLDSKAVAA
ncbi:MAG TPA: C1 family peptidase [Gemmataceae bacterium]|nr:C1 family peptidase [Gemmataceae bacterium]